MSEWYQIESNNLIIQVVSKGAEMKRLFHKVWNRELLWPGVDKTWERSSPILFPIVGKLKDDEFTFNGKNYHMPRHGFARDSEFICTNCGLDEIEFVLNTSRETYQYYPFFFELGVKYKVEDSVVTVTCKIVNVDQTDMYFSIGAHPGFETKNIANYDLQFEKSETEYWKLKNELINNKKPYPFRNNKLQIDKELFRDDALIFPNIKSNYVDLIDNKMKKSIRVRNIKNNFLGIWSKGEVPFVCIEPWQGISDIEDHDKDLTKKIGIMKLSPGAEHLFSYQIEMLSIV